MVGLLKLVVVGVVAGATLWTLDGLTSVAAQPQLVVPVRVQDEATDLTPRFRLNFTGAGVSCADDAGNARTDCTIAGGGGGNYDTVQDEGSPLTQRPVLNLIGSAVSCVDNAGNTSTDCTVTGGSGGLDHPAVMSRGSVRF